MAKSPKKTPRVNDRKLGNSWKHWDGDIERHESELDEGPDLYFALFFLGMTLSTVILLLDGYLLLQRMLPEVPIAIPIIIVIIGAPLSIWWIAYLCCLAIVAWRVRLVSFPWLSKWLPMQVPYLTFLGRFFGISRDRISSSCIAVTNCLAMLRLRPDIAQRPLVLLPRCIRADTVRAIKSVAAEHDCPVEVMATNKMARKKVAEFKPTVVLAVACERDLVSGIYDFAHKLPIVVVANNRPEGPCLRCGVDMERFRQRLEAICEGEVEDEELPRTMSIEEHEDRVAIREVGRQEYGALTSLFDIILPRVCSVCDGALDSREQIICQSCRSAFQAVSEPVCPICGSWREESRTNREGKCPKCPGMELYFSETHVPFYYRGALGDALKHFKYHRRLEMAESIGRAAFMALVHRERRGGMSEMEEEDDPTGLRELVDVVAPVPLHYTRFLVRGYNQSELLARPFARLAGLQVDAKILKRIRRTPRQALLPAEKRYDNVRGAFQVTNPHLVRGKAVAVFDDVFTSGHTVNQCARVLVEAGAKKVLVLAIARA